MRIAVIGWGSLVWDPGDLRIKDDGWHVGGPLLPIELSRVSERRGYLTYVIDERHVRKVQTRFALSRYSHLEDAVADLACREGCAAHSVGFVEAKAGKTHRSRTVEGWRGIWDWLSTSPTPAEAAVWTDLEPRFEGLFTLDAAVEFWRTLPAGVASEARNYAEHAPAEVDTDLRRRLHNEGLIA